MLEYSEVFLRGTPAYFEQCERLFGVSQAQCEIKSVKYDHPCSFCSVNTNQFRCYHHCRLLWIAKMAVQSRCGRGIHAARVIKSKRKPQREAYSHYEWREGARKETQWLTPFPQEEALRKQKKRGIVLWSPCYVEWHITRRNKIKQVTMETSCFRTYQLPRPAAFLSRSTWVRVAWGCESHGITAEIIDDLVVNAPILQRRWGAL